MSELKPCPFCGGEAILESNKLRYGTIYSAYCQKCGAEITGFSEHEAVAAWNRRAQPDNEPLTCEGCEGKEQYESEVEYGYPSPCTRCRRRSPDNYRRRKPEPEIQIGIDYASGNDSTAWPEGGEG